MSIDGDIALLEKVPLLNLLGRAALRILAIGAESRHLRAGEVLFYAGDDADCGFVVQEGSVGLRPERADGKSDDMVAGRGTLLGEIAMMTPTTRPATATALEPSTVMRISRGLFLKMLEGYPEAARRLRDDVAARTDNWTHELQNVREAWERREVK